MGRVMRSIVLVCVAVLVVIGGAWAWYRYHVRPVSVNGSNTANGNTAASNDPAVLAAGDIATCGIRGSMETAEILGITEGTILALGDEAYPTGSAENFRNCYGPAWGKFLTRTRPVPGNHEYLTKNASAYFSYFGASANDPAKGYYSYDLGAWHVVALNSQCDAVGGCGADSPEVKWFANDLASHSSKCTLAYWHVPRFSSGLHGSSETMQSLWQAAVEGGVDVVLNGHDHLYERLAPMDANGSASMQGIREFVVGTGGTSHYNFTHILPTSEARDNTTFGVVKLILHASSYDWDFMPVAGGTYHDSGTTSCH